MRVEDGLKFPMGCVYLTVEEMERSVGGSINIGMNRGYLNKTICLDQAKGIIKTFKWTNVTSSQLAKEIYGHAMVFYKWATLASVPLLNEAVYSHVADGVDLDNKVDKYQTVWNVLWNF